MVSASSSASKRALNVPLRVACDVARGIQSATAIRASFNTLFPLLTDHMERVRLPMFAMWLQDRLHDRFPT